VKDYAKASQAFADGSKNPNAKIWMKVMAAKIAAEGESFETSAFLWHDVYQSATDPDTKQGALDHLELLQAQQDCRKIDQVADEYEKRTAHRATRMIQLVQAGLLPATLADPLGFPYELGGDGKAHLNAKSPLRQKQQQFQPPQ
jgi:glutamine synthetase adenylyltransferase